MRSPEAVATSPDGEIRTARLASLGVFVLAFFLLSFFFLSLPSIPDTDSYYHLAVAREYAAKGFVKGLSWARFSVMGTALGDKEVLFHVLLIPFVTLT
ncbi:MAG: hypothetical protein ABIT01_11535, partial [Thermoanaerobaculia bacterium]